MQADGTPIVFADDPDLAVKVFAHRIRARRERRDNQRAVRQINCHGPAAIADALDAHCPTPAEPRLPKIGGPLADACFTETCSTAALLLVVHVQVPCTLLVALV